MGKNFIQIGLIILILAVLAGVSAFFVTKMQKQSGSEAAAPEQTAAALAVAKQQPAAETAAPAAQTTETPAAKDAQPAAEPSAPAQTADAAAPSESPAATTAEPEEELTGFETLPTP